MIQGSHCPKMKMLDQAFLNSSNCKKISSVNSVIIITACDSLGGDSLIS